ncbi:MAG: hypothetical protein ACYTGC_16930 [Planctomycetota bacterium]|jgi:hypothetical protein
MSDSTRLCAKCGYRLSRLRGRVCPECGEPFHPDDEGSWSTPMRRRWTGVAFCVIVLLALNGNAAVLVMWASRFGGGRPVTQGTAALVATLSMLAAAGVRAVALTPTHADEGSRRDLLSLSLALSPIGLFVVLAAVFVAMRAAG